MKITNLIEIKNYAAGQNGNLLVSLDDNLVQEQSFAELGAGKESQVKMLICVAYVDDEAAQEILARYVDDPEITPVDRVIVVSKRFLRLCNKKKLILLERQNRLEDDIEVTSNMDKQSYANIMTIGEYGRFFSRLAFRTEDRVRERSESRIGGRVHRAMRKGMRGQTYGMGKGESDASTIHIFGDDAADGAIPSDA